MKEEIKQFSEIFTSRLGGFVSNMNTEGMGKYGLNEDELKAIFSETFYLLGKNHRELKKRAKVK